MQSAMWSLYFVLSLHFSLAALQHSLDWLKVVLILQIQYLADATERWWMLSQILFMSYAIPSTMHFPYCTKYFAQNPVFSLPFLKPVKVEMKWHNVGSNKKSSKS